MRSHRFPGNEEERNDLGDEATGSFLIGRMPHEVAEGPQRVGLHGVIGVLQAQEERLDASAIAC